MSSSCYKCNENLNYIFGFAQRKQLNASKYNCALCILHSALQTRPQRCARSAPSRERRNLLFTTDIVLSSWDLPRSQRACACNLSTLDAHRTQLSSIGPNRYVVCMHGDAEHNHKFPLLQNARAFFVEIFECWRAASVPH